MRCEQNSGWILLTLGQLISANIESNHTYIFFEQYTLAATDLILADSAMLLLQRIAMSINWGAARCNLIMKSSYTLLSYSTDGRKKKVTDLTYNKTQSAYRVQFGVKEFGAMPGVEFPSKTFSKIILVHRFLHNKKVQPISRHFNKFISYNNVTTVAGIPSCFGQNRGYVFTIKDLLGFEASLLVVHL